ncbi:putative bifunctional diguanylate cyclase/phosphodiesterase [Blastococcus deserti]|uniref:Bifunctional diguanylate cyclase/phosphodiesterase n=1 Tax=Blastococcus deserti TaxID=2259033 RepID=A0ABW4XEF2_9ACTN
MSRSLSVRARMGAGVAAMALPLVAVSGTAIGGLETTLDSFADTKDEAIEEALPLARLQSLVVQVERDGQLAVLQPEASPPAAYEAARDRMADAFAALGGQQMTEEGDLASVAEVHARRAVAVLDEAVRSPATTAAERSTAASRLTEARGHVEEAVTALEQAEELASADILDEYEDAHESQRVVLGWIVAAAGIGLVVALAGGLHLTRSVLRPLGAFREAIRRLGDGMLSHRVELPSGDEFGTLARTFNAMAEQLERQQQELFRSARHDALTGLPNRVQLREHLDAALSADGATSLLLIDLDGFKSINDTLGHSVGDEVLCTVADRLRRTLRAGDLAVRLGGDEFAVAVSGDEAEAGQIATRVLDAVRPAIRHADRDLFLTASIGVASVSASASSAEDLLRLADLAMYQAKNDGKDDVRVHDAQRQEAIEDRMRLATDLPGALQAGELVLHYQPVHAIDGHDLVAVEALMRWEHPTLGLVSPGSFIPLAEKTGLIVPIGAWALDEACRQLREWRTLFGNERGLQMSVNVSARQLADEGFAALVGQTLSRHGIPAGSLVLEITESMLVEDQRSEVSRLAALKQIGVQLAVDDFGTGYSSLSYLPRFPVDQLKIDRSLVEQIDQPRGKAVAAGIIELARVLGLESVAEGIEDENQLTALAALGCALGQGFHLARPAAAADITERLAEALSGRQMSARSC